MTELDRLRREIDEIDTALHDLLVRRVAIGRDIAAAKAGQPAPSRRPGREARIIRRLAAQNRPPLSVASITRIWREILSANLSQQTSLTAAAFAPDGRIALLAHDYCGSATALALHDSAEQVLDAVAGGTAQIGVLPGFKTPRATPWWPAVIAMAAPDRPRVIARLPLIDDGGAAPDAIVVAAQEPESSGDDRTVFIVRQGTHGGADRVVDSWTGCGRWDLVEVDGFAVEAGSDGGDRLCLGAYARPVIV